MAITSSNTKIPDSAPSIVNIPSKTLFAGVCRSRGSFISISFISNLGLR